MVPRGSGNGVSLLPEHAPRGQTRQVADAGRGACTALPKSSAGHPDPGEVAQFTLVVWLFTTVTVSLNAHLPSVAEQVADVGVYVG